MSKFTLVLCAVAVTLSSVYASEEEIQAFHKAIAPFLVECSKEHGVSDVDLEKAKETRSPDGLNPCFMGCVFKKANVINDKGDFDLDTGLTKLKEFVKNDDEYAKFANIAKECASVNDKPVSDGAAGCERAALLMGCFMEHKSEISV